MASSPIQRIPNEIVSINPDDGGSRYTCTTTAQIKAALAKMLDDTPANSLKYFILATNNATETDLLPKGIYSCVATRTSSSAVYGAIIIFSYGSSGDASGMWIYKDNDHLATHMSLYYFAGTKKASW